MEDKVELYTGKQVKELLKISESTYRTILKNYRDYILVRKGNKNLDLYPYETVEVFSTIYRLRKMGLTKSEIVKDIKKTPSYLESRVKNGIVKENKDLVEILGSDNVPELVNEFVSRISSTKKEIKSLRRTLDKRTENYQKEIGDLETKLKDSETRSNETITKMLKTVWKLEEELKEYKNRTIFERLKGLFKF